jgi:hypothetical protein
MRALRLSGVVDSDPSPHLGQNLAFGLLILFDNNQNKALADLPTYSLRTMAIPTLSSQSSMRLL